MPGTPIDSAIYRSLFGDTEVGALFTDSAEVRAMMLVEGALAKVQGELGVIPETAGSAIHRASLELQIDPGGLAAGAAQSAVPVPALVEMFREAMQAPEHAAYVHWGATSQDIMDTGLALRLRQALAICDTRLANCASRLADLAEAQADTPMVARTYGQAAVITSFGAQVASLGTPLLRYKSALSDVSMHVAQVSLFGAAGTLSAMEKGPEVRAGLAKALGLNHTDTPWHCTRDNIANLASWATGVCGALGKMGEDILLLRQHGIGEIDLASAGGSSTMPQKQNPVAPSVLSAIARQSVGLNSVIQSALPHRQNRDAAAWMSEWLSLPQLILLTARALEIAATLSKEITPNHAAMAASIQATNGMIYAEALSFALANHMPRPEAQAATKAFVAKAHETQTTLQEVAPAAHPELDFTAIFDPTAQMGEAPAQARAFAKAARTL